MSSSCLPLSSLKWSGALHAHTGRCQHSPLQQFAKASRGQFKHARMDGTGKRSWDRCDSGASDWGQPGRKWKCREGGRGGRAHAPVGGSLWSPLRPGLYAAAHRPTAGYPHPGQSRWLTAGFKITDQIWRYGEEPTDHLYLSNCPLSAI